MLGQNAIVGVSEQLGKMNNVEVPLAQPAIGVDRDADALRNFCRMCGGG